MLWVMCLLSRTNNFTRLVFYGKWYETFKKEFCRTEFDGIVRRIFLCVTLVLGTAEYTVSLWSPHWFNWKTVEICCKCVISCILLVDVGDPYRLEIRPIHSILPDAKLTLQVGLQSWDKVKVHFLNSVGPPINI